MRYDMTLRDEAMCVERRSKVVTLNLWLLEIAPWRKLVYVIVSFCDFFIQILNNCVFFHLYWPKRTEKNCFHFSVHFFVGKFKMAATGNQKSYNRYIFGIKR